MRRQAIVVAALLVTALVAAAHDTWLVPESFHVTPGQPVRVALNTSEDFPTSEAATTPDRIAYFGVVSAAGRWEMEEGRVKLSLKGTLGGPGHVYGAPRVEGKSLVATITPWAGVTLAAMVTRPQLIVLEAPVFAEYITEEGLEQIVAARAARGESDQPGRERYSKIAKLALCADGEGADFRQPLGLRLELIPENDPCALRVGDTLNVQVLFDGRPLEGVWVSGGYAGVHGHHYPVWVKTDSGGQAVVPLDRAGAWFVRTLHMVPSTEFADADWQSWFSTFTFAVE